MRNFSLLGYFLAGLLASMNVSAQEIQTMEPQVPAGENNVICGDRARPQDWPATRIFGKCTATVVGEKAVLTAAHCIHDGATLHISVKGKAYATRCTVYPGYVASVAQTKAASFDYALCSTKDKIEGIIYETVNTSSAFPVKDSQVLLVGFGCTKGDQGAMSNIFRNLFKGSATVKSVPSGGWQYITTGPGENGECAAVCSGDSGGAAYVKVGGARRVIVGINSRGNLSDTSFLSATNSLPFIEWARDTWAPKNGAAICGINPEATGCR